MLSLLLLVLAADAGSSDAGGPDGGYDPALPSTWQLSAKLPADGGAREALIAELMADAGRDPRAVGEAPLTRAEALAVLDDPRSELVYGEKTVAIVAPSMLVKQRQDHLDLMKLFLKPERVAAGAKFAAEHAAVLSRMEQKYGVDGEAIIGILMWESKLGTITGDWRVFNAFTSQAYFVEQANEVAMARPDEKQQTDEAKQKRRVASIRDRAHQNLLALLRQCKARGIDPLSVKGSWAGALGYPQFMPASLRWADDGNGDGVIDLFDFDDAIFSVGRYLSEHGWAKSQHQAVWDYNHEEAYVQGVLAFADALKHFGEPDAGAAAGPADGGAPAARARHRKP
jgi:membrane-bound lytic murein transglycosylase B